MKTFRYDNKDFLEINVGDGPRTPYYYESDGRKEAFIRSGNESLPAPKHMLDNLILKGQNVTYDELPSKYKIGDVSFTLFKATIKKEIMKETDEEKDYLSYELVTHSGNITNAGLLLSDQGILKQSRIFCTKWKGLIKGSIIGDAIDDKEYKGSIISLLENAEIFIKNNSKVSWEIEGMKRVEKADYPLRAIREAIVNAIVHRDYQILGSEIHIDMFDDRLEITSPGGMMDGSFIQNLDITKISSIRRNRIISDIFNRLNFMERRGSGLIRIMESYSDSLVKPTFTSDISTFKVVFPNKNYKLVNINVDTKEENKNLKEEDYFIIKMHKNLPLTIRNNTFNQIKCLFQKFGYKYNFKREDIEILLKVKKTRAIDIIFLLNTSNLIEVIDSNKYRFKE